MPWWKFWAKEDARSAPDYYEEGVALAGQERYHEALTSFRLALRERPEDAATLEQMAVIYTHIGLPEEAIKLYRSALEISPRSPSAHYGIAFLLLRRGAEVEAAEHLRRFLALGAGDMGQETEKHVRHARETLARLSSRPKKENDHG